jgi:hypothetical protein
LSTAKDGIAKGSLHVQLAGYRGWRHCPWWDDWCYGRRYGYYGGYRPYGFYGPGFSLRIGPGYGYRDYHHRRRWAQERFEHPLGRR